MMRMRTQSLLEQRYWDTHWESTTLGGSLAPDYMQSWIQGHIPAGTGSCLEIGCFPGRFLAVFGALGYVLHGIDLTPRVAELPEWLTALGFTTGTFVRADFLTHEFSSQYDVVCSFGFIEHFVEWEDVLRKHAGLVQPGGYLVVSTPNFGRGLQRLLHASLDRESYDRHYIPSMQPHLWARVLQPVGFRILHAGYFGQFDFWYGQQRRTAPQRMIVDAVMNRRLALARILPRNSPLASPCCGLIGRRDG